MRNALLLAVLAAAISLPIAAPAATGMAAMQYYVGNWACVSSAAGETPDKAASSFTLESGLLRQTVTVAPQGKMKTPYILSIATTYDSKNGRYVQTGLDNIAGWWISYAKPWSGDTEEWADHANSTGKLGHGSTVRSQNNFTITAYETMTATKPSFKVTCTRST
jgi:hypothetical protein